MLIRKSQDKIHPNFSHWELFCKSFDFAGDSHELDDKVIEALFWIREYYGSPITVTSTLRTPAHNASIGGAKHSKHMYGFAIDFQLKNKEAREQYYIDMKDKNSQPFKRLRKIGVSAFGLYDNFYHIDSADYTSRTGGHYQTDNYGKWKQWDYTKKKAELLLAGRKKTATS